MTSGAHAALLNNTKNSLYVKLLEYSTLGNNFVQVCINLLEIHSFVIAYNKLLVPIPAAVRSRAVMVLYYSNIGIVGLNPARGIDIRGGIQMFLDWPPGARTANGTALCH
jgi:hypothetical protein